MNIWTARENSLIWLDNELKPQDEAIQKGFEFINNYAVQFEKHYKSEGECERGHFCRVCAISFAKVCHLLIGCYSLTLDGLAQESGALLRPVIEIYEKLVYFREDKSRIYQITERKLPSAGEIGQIISGDFKDLRSYFNKNASHFGFEFFFG